jgi:hypothetical protein
VGELAGKAFLLPNVGTNRRMAMNSNQLYYLVLFLCAPIIIIRLLGIFLPMPRMPKTILIGVSCFAWFLYVVINSEAILRIGSMLIK